MKSLLIITSTVVTLSGCAIVPQDGPKDMGAKEASEDTNSARQLPQPPVSARTVDEFDTTTNADRQAALEDDVTDAGKSLGITVASLGDPTKPGFWMETPLVKQAAKGSVAYDGRTISVDLIPIEAEKTAGSRLSLAAMRLLDAPLTGLPKVQVFLRSP